ncbi:hypothetical protein GTA08_BOTSDO00728 [Botryosphaeria dothidea]|uniref:SnoaL-like domain-containing protein n=1 Tax=Botryosphaeria dothidea TaxID=55169 RepID=A0A8H4J808_9PEZI|nr:hypothetical protein GTA08_BOTSDO00728 [Botryosphaeria dothidea]
MSSSVRTREDLDRYIVAFNTNDYDTYASFYSPDVEMNLGATVVKGKDEIIKWFKEARKRILEYLEVEHVFIGEKAVALTEDITFTALIDFDEPFYDVGPPVQKGGGYKAPFVIFYDLDEQGRMKTLNAGRIKPAVVN